VNIKLPHISVLFKRLLLAYGLYTFCRLLFFVTYFQTFSAQPVSKIVLAFLSGIWFDTSAIMYSFGLLILMHLIPLPIRNKKGYQLTIKCVFMLAAVIGLTLNFIDIGYFTFSGKRSGFELIKMQSAQNVSPLVYVMDYWYLLIILLASLFMVWRIYPRLNTINQHQNKTPLILEFLVMFVLSGLFFLGARGSVGLKPLNTLDAAKISGAELMPLTLNTTFQMLMTIEQTGINEKNYMSENEAQNLFNPNHTNPNIHATPKKNVVLIILESVGKEYVGFYNNGVGYTPFIDSLMQHSEVYMHAYANGKRSIEGIPAIIASMPSWITGDYINSFYQTNTLHSIGYYLTKSGYQTSFYHGGKNGTMSFDRFVANTQAGIYYGLNEYPNKEKDFDGHWGIPDEPYLQYVTTELTQQKEPFFSTVFTLSSHHPYEVPAAYKNKFKGGPLPIHATVEYTDYALKNFFETAKKHSWYNNTIFVFTADHSSENTQLYYQTAQGKYAIPLFVFDASKTIKDSLPLEVYETIDHLGIMPLILNKVTPTETPYFSFAGKGAIQFDGGVYQLIQHPFVLKFDGEKSIGFYNLQKDSLMLQNMIANKTAPVNDVNKMEHYLKAVIQQYNHRLITNKTH
jgi:phosphoglycerol transferase MdoB-like AlkP superfamily enzyme